MSDLYEILDRNLYKIGEIKLPTEINPDSIGSGSLLASFNQVLNVLESGKTKFDNSQTGYILGLDAGTAKFYIGDSTSYINWDGSTLTVQGGLVVDSLDIPDTTTANSFHVNTDGDAWWGATTIGSATAKVLKTGVATFTDITATGTINATGGYIGATTALAFESTGINCGTTGHIRGGQTDYFTGTGFFLGYSGAAYKLSIGSSSQFLTWDGSSLTLTGGINHLAGDILYQSANTERNTASTTYTMLKEIAVWQPGAYRIKFDLKSFDVTNATAYGRIYKNGVAAGTERNASAYTTYSEDLTDFISGDLIQLYVKKGAGTSEGHNSPSATGGSHNEWTDPTNAYSSNDAYTTYIGDGSNHYQSYETFGFTLGAGSNIDGIELKVEGKYSGAGSGDPNILFQIYSTSVASWSSQDLAVLTTSDAIYTIGGATSLWGTTWIGSDFSNANFKIRMYTATNTFKTYHIDHIQVKVYYGDQDAYCRNFRLYTSQYDSSTVNTD